MKKFLIFASLAAIFLFSFTMMNDEGKDAGKALQNKNTEVVESNENSDIDKKLEEIEKLDFSKIETSKENPDFDAHAGLD